MYYNFPPGDAIKIAEEQFSQKRTFKDKFKVAWNLIAPYIKESPDIFVKTVDDSILWRKRGNEEYTTAKGKYYLSESIIAYTKSIAYAPVGSEELSLAYANRSAVLFRARLFEDCLLDIERSLEAGYPDKLKTKLFLRQSLCFKALKPSSHIESGISMASAMQWLPDLKKYNPTYDINKEYPKMIQELKEPREIIKFIPEIKNDNAIVVGASDAIELKKTNENNQHIVATRDLKTGEFIYISEPFAATIGNQLRFTNCWHCCRRTWTGVPCDNCPKIIYCSDSCKKKAWNSYHNIECLVLGQLLNFLVVTTDIFPVKIFLKAINLENNLIELKKKIDEIDSINDKTMILTNGKLDVNNIDNFHRLDYFKAASTECNFESALLAVFIVTIFGQKTDILGETMTFKDLIKSKNKKIIILGELILRYMMIVERNGQLFTERGPGIVWSNVLVPFYKLLKQSCDPDVDWTHFGSNIGYYVCKPIKKGKPIVFCFNEPYHELSKSERYLNLALVTDDPIQCECTACIENWPPGRFLPSYQSMILPTRIKRELDSMAIQLTEWRKLIDQGDPKQLLTIKDDFNKMNDKFHEYITVPCREISILSIYLKTLYCQLHIAHDIVD